MISHSMIRNDGKVMLGEFAGGSTGRLLIDISDHTHCTPILQYGCPVLGSVAVLSSLSAWWSISLFVVSTAKSSTWPSNMFHNVGSLSQSRVLFLQACTKKSSIHQMYQKSSKYSELVTK